jgi:hypothetical protein
MPKYIKPTLATKFHIDFSWWQEKNQNLRAFLQSHACEACQESAQKSENQTFDWVNPQTGEVFRLDILWHLINTHCAQDPNFIDSHIPLTSAIFRAFIANNNTPLTPVEIYEVVQKQSPDLILKTIGGRQVYNGIKPAGF